MSDDRFNQLQTELVGFLSLYTSMRHHMLAHMRANMADVPDLAVSCPEELCITVGKPMRSKIKESRFPAMRAGNCFANAFRLTLEDPTLTYVEGWALMEQSFPTHHAWVMHEDGHISDPTWLTVIAEQLGDNPNAKMLPDWQSRCVYLGVPITQTQHLGWFQEYDTPNILAFGETSPECLLLRGMKAFEQVDVTDPHTIALFREDAIKTLDEHSPWEVCTTPADMARGQFRRLLENGQFEYWSGAFA